MHDLDLPDPGFGLKHCATVAVPDLTQRELKTIRCVPPRSKRAPFRLYFWRNSKWRKPPFSAYESPEGFVNYLENKIISIENTDSDGYVVSKTGRVVRI